MNRADSGTSPMPTPICAAFAPLLPLLAGGELSAEDTVATRTHLESCRWCQSQLATYDTLDAALRRHYGEGEHTTYFLTTEDVMSDFEQDAEITQPAYSTLNTPATPGTQPPRGPAGRLSAIGAVAAVLLIALFAGTIYALHGSQGRQPTGSATATSTTAPTASAVPMASTTPTATAFSEGCGENGGTPLSASGIQFTRYGLEDRYYFERLANDLALRPQVVGNVANVPGAPVKASVPSVALKDNAIFDLAIPAPPANQPGYICAATVRIVSFQPLSGPANNVYHPCTGQSYADPGGWNPSTACPAAPLSAGHGTVTLTTATVGTTATGAITGLPVNGQPSNQPAVEPPPPAGPGTPGATDIVVDIKVPQAGTYTFAISLWQDRSGPSITIPDVTLQFLFGQALHEWSGEACTQPDMQSQLPPPTNPPAQLICPGPPPQ